MSKINKALDYIEEVLVCLCLIAIHQGETNIVLHTVFGKPE